MKLTFAVILSAILTMSCLAQDYHFVGFYQKPEAGKSYWCADSFMEEKGLANRDEYSRVRKAFFDAHKKESPATHLLTPDNAALVYEFRKPLPGFNCIPNALGIVTGADVEGATRQLAKRIAEHPKSYASKPRIIFTWKGGEYKKTVVRTYDGVEIKFTSAKASAGKTAVFAQGKNTSTDNTAVVVLTMDGKPSGKPILVPPGGRFNHNLGKGENVSVDVRYISHEEASTGVIDFIKSTIRDWITVKDGRMKPTRDTGPAERN
ncbi:MAG: hypothetical protein HYZ01_07540 [Ignavibacteriales bacterium]|nr:hypothetical protein [Ignavibacteriales bacterium]